MGRCFTPPYRVEYRDQDGWHTQAWTNKKGIAMVRKVPTLGDAEEWRKGMNASFNKGGNNYHVSLAANKILHISEVRIKRQRDGVLVAYARAPMFEVV